MYVKVHTYAYLWSERHRVNALFHIHVHTHIHSNNETRIYASRHVCIDRCMYIVVNMYITVHTYVYLWSKMHRVNARLHIYIHTNLHSKYQTRICTSLHLCIHVYTYVYRCIQKYTRMHTCEARCIEWMRACNVASTFTAPTATSLDFWASFLQCVHSNVCHLHFTHIFNLCHVIYRR